MPVGSVHQGSATQPTGIFFCAAFYELVDWQGHLQHLVTAHMAVGASTKTPIARRGFGVGWGRLWWGLFCTCSTLLLLLGLTRCDDTASGHDKWLTSRDTGHSPICIRSRCTGMLSRCLPGSGMYNSQQQHDSVVLFEAGLVLVLNCVCWTCFSYDLSHSVFSAHVMLDSTDGICAY